MGLTIGVDVGGTKIAAGVVDEDGAILSRLRRESPADDTEAIQETISDLIHELRADHDVEGVGVGAPGFVDVSRSTVLFAPNLAWRDEPVKDGPGAADRAAGGRGERRQRRCVGRVRVRGRR